MKRISLNLIVYVVTLSLGFLLFIPASTSAQTNTQAYTLTISSIDTTKISLTWNAPSNGNLTNDWIGLYKLDGVVNPIQSYQAWEYLKEATTTVTFLTPKVPGAYMFVYFKNGSYQAVAQSDLIKIPLDSNTKKTVSSNPDATSTRTVVPASSSNSASQYQTSSNQQTKKTVIQQATQIGTYSVTIANNGNTLSANTPITVQWRSPQGANIQGDWIGLYQTNRGDLAPVTWQYIYAPSGTITFAIPTGNTWKSYNMRYFKNNKYNSVAQSNSITVQQ